MVRQLKENMEGVITNCDKDGKAFEAGLKSISKKLEALIPELAKVMVLVQNDNTGINNHLISTYANCRELSNYIKSFGLDK